jgi:methyl-accepting chemotaxis protein
MLGISVRMNLPDQTSASIDALMRFASDLADAEAVIERSVRERDYGTDAVRELAMASAKIASMVGTLTTIAKTTNMLALNASIEAQRHGLEGAAFAVVAAEVKALAIQSMGAAADVRGVADGLNEKAIAAVQRSEEAGETLRGLFAAAGRMRERLDADLHKITNISP